MTSHLAVDMCQGHVCGLEQEAPMHDNHPSTLYLKRHLYYFAYQALSLFSIHHRKSRWSLGTRLSQTKNEFKKWVDLTIAFPQTWQYLYMHHVVPVGFQESPVVSQ